MQYLKDSKVYHRLLYRRQFLITQAPIKVYDDWTCTQVDQFFIYSHPDLEIIRLGTPNVTIALLGQIYDYEEPGKGNAEILEDIVNGANGTEQLVARMKRYSGCYALFIKHFDKAIILHDARGLREIYYCMDANQIVCGSQPNLVADFSLPKIVPTNDDDLLDFYNNYLWDSRWVGDETYFAGVKHLLPNHYLDMNKRKPYRYWPDQPVPRLRLEDAVSKSSIILKGVMKAIVNRHSAMMALTAGTDSRLLLAASKEILDKTYFFINNDELSCDNPEISVPKALSEKMGFRFYVHDVPKNVDAEFRQIFFLNTFLASDRILPSIFNVFFKQHEKKVLILGVSEIGRNFYGWEPKHLSGYRMAYKLGYRKCRYAIKQFERLAPELESVSNKFKVGGMTLLYWEQRLGNWGAVRNSESLIAIEKIDPFNSHLLYETLLGVKVKYRNYLHSPCVLAREMIRSMWPELLAWPINPPYTIIDRITWLLVKPGLYEPLKEVKYQINRLIHIMKR